MEIYGENLSVELPSYECRPINVRKEEVHLGPQLQLKDVAILPGTSSFFAKGLAIIRPVKDGYAGYLTISLVGSEEVIYKGSLGLREVREGRESIYSRTTLPLYQDFKKGFVYEYEFSFQCFSDEKADSSKCQTKYCSSHTATPPSVGGEASVSESFYDISIRYFVEGRIDTSKLAARKFVHYLPGTTFFDLNVFRDAIGPLNRLYEVGTTLRNGFLKSNYNGTLALQMYPIYHYNQLGASENMAHGVVDFKVLYFPSDGFVSYPKLSATYNIKRVMTAAVGGMTFMIDDEKHNTKRFSIAHGKIDLSTTKWQGSTLGVSVRYEVQSLLFRTPTYASCLSYGGYEFTLTVKYSSGEMSLTVPLVVQSMAPSSYS